ncbi:hypothetical protein COU57_06350 [Candidatus Pacearchaeota archaeon CG10_big_fil_rev_8_21_14_0_10_32_14]|nr:MAG: hypothetical protein COU57_06350 [Candidatus Pacearchaeota archaeon CG10_big_fil_rev_8_21_14_0_10_32_14]
MVEKVVASYPGSFKSRIPDTYFVPGRYEELFSLVQNFEVVTVKDDHTEEHLRIYDAEKVMSKLQFLPEYVQEATYHGLKNQRMPAQHYKIVADKWGKKDASTKKYVETPEIIFYRAAMLAAKGIVDNDPSLDYEETVKDIFERFERREIFPNTPYMANGGHKLISNYISERAGENASADLINELEQEKRIREQLFACFVLPIYDSRDSILRETLPNAADIQASIGGTGFNFSNLRPANETIHGTGGNTDGPVSFMATYSNVLGKTMNQGGKREGANMFMLDYNHPDIMRFIYSKRQDGEIPAANISVAIYHPFMEAVKSDGEERFYPLKNPHHNPKLRPHIPEFYTAKQLQQTIEVSKGNSKAKISMELAENGIDVLSPWLGEGMSEEYRIIGKIGEDGIVYIDAKKVMHHLSYGAWYNGEPGMIINGTINDQNPTHPRNYKEFLLDQSSPKSREIISEIQKRDINKPLELLVEEFISEKDIDGRPINLPIGVGVMEATNPCGEKPLLPYEACVLGHVSLEKMVIEDANSPSGYNFDTEKFLESSRLIYEILDNAIDQNAFTLPLIEQTQKSNRKIGVGFMGLANLLYKLELPYNSQEARDFVDDILKVWEDETDKASYDKASKFGAFPNFEYSHHRNGAKKRNAIVRTIAPTGTTGFAAQTTGGMEPEYALAYSRTTVQGTRVDMFNPVLEEKLEKYSFFLDSEEKKRFHCYISDFNGGKGSLQEFELVKGKNESDSNFEARLNNLNKIKKIFVTTYDISPEDHLYMEAVVQRHVDDAISKTTNFRNNATVEDVERAFLMAYDLGIKGITFYRDGTRKDQPLKVKGEKTPERNERRSLRDLIIERLDKPRPEIVAGPQEKVQTPFGKAAYIRLNYEKDELGRDIAPYESFVDIGRGDEDLSAIAEGYGRLLSLAIKGGIPVEYIVASQSNIGGKSQVGIGESKIKSLPDAIAKGLVMAMNQESKMQNVLRHALEGNGTLDLTDNPNSQTNGKKPKSKKSGNFCPSCGGGQLMIKEGCEICDCGFSRCG